MKNELRGAPVKIVWILLVVSLRVEPPHVVVHQQYDTQEACERDLRYYAPTIDIAAGCVPAGVRK
jgi:hypothetical protein